MSDAEPYGPETRRTGIPRDLPDQEAAGTEEETDPAVAEKELPEPDEAGSGLRRSAPAPGEGEVEPPEAPEPQEPTD